VVNKGKSDTFTDADEKRLKELEEKARGVK